jgi:hypothetical protein
MSFPTQCLLRIFTSFVAGKNGCPMYAFNNCIYLHACLLLITRLPHQEFARGYISKDMEFAVERLVQDYKSYTGRRVSSGPEKTYVNHVLQGYALSNLLRDNPNLLTMRDMVDKTRLTTIATKKRHLEQPVVFDGPGVLGGTASQHMVGRGRKPNTLELKCLAAGLKTLFGIHQPDLPDWMPSALQNISEMRDMAVASCAMNGRVFPSATYTNFTFTAMGQGKGNTRCNFFVQVITCFVFHKLF